MKINVNGGLDYLPLPDTFKLINIAVATSNIKEINTPTFKLRPSLHTIICGRIGSMKSTILLELCRQMKTTPYFNLTPANLLGTIDKQTGETLLPATWECRNSILPIDELDFDCHSTSSHNALTALLSVLESPNYQKKMGYRSNNFSKKSKGLYCIVKDGTISVKTRFVFIASTMMELHKKQRMIELKALKTRCLILPYYPTITDLRNTIDGKLEFKYKKYTVPEIVNIDKETFKAIADLVEESNISKEQYVRTIGDLCRAYAVVGFDKRIFYNILSLKTDI